MSVPNLIGTDLAARWRLVVKLIVSHLSPQEEPRYTSGCRVIPQGRSGLIFEKRKSLAPTGVRTPHRPACSESDGFNHEYKQTLCYLVTVVIKLCKGKVTLMHVMKTYRNGGIAPLILNLGIRRGYQLHARQIHLGGRTQLPNEQEAGWATRPV